MADGVCFVSGTRIRTEEGSKNIEEIAPGDHVYAKNTDTGETGYKEVVRVFEKETDELVHLQIGDIKIDTTPNHPFWVNGYGFREAGELREGDEVETADGGILKVTGVKKEYLEEPVTVYNFEVADWHTYYVSETGVLVHNTCYMEPGVGKSGSKTVDHLIKGLKETTDGKGIARNFETSGGYEQTLKDFEALNLTNVKDIQTKYGPGKVGILNDGTKIVARQGSTTGGATLEIKISNSKVYKIRY